MVYITIRYNRTAASGAEGKSHEGYFDEMVVVQLNIQKI